MTVNLARLIFFDYFQNGHISGALAELIRSTRAPIKDRLIGKIMGGNPVFRGTRVPVHRLAELVPSRVRARTRRRRGSVGPGAPGVKQQLAAVRMLFDWLITGQIVPMNPAAAVRGPKHVVKTGKTPVLEGDEWRKLLASIPTANLRDLRDRALIATLTYSFARITAALKMKVEDLRPRGAGWTVRLHEKGGKDRSLVCERTAGVDP
jgi:site-specific recombinase XerC